MNKYKEASKSRKEGIQQIERGSCVAPFTADEVAAGQSRISGEKEES
jgi:hypothetical protein